jgi:hypothetical protein
MLVLLYITGLSGTMPDVRSDPANAFQLFTSKKQRGTNDGMTRDETVLRASEGLTFRVVKDYFISILSSAYLKRMLFNNCNCYQSFGEARIRFMLCVCYVFMHLCFVFTFAVFSGQPDQPRHSHVHPV